MPGIPSRVLRGGSFNNQAPNLRSAYRNNNHPDNDNDNIGFRVVWVSAGGQDVAEPRFRRQSSGPRETPPAGSVPVFLSSRASGSRDNPRAKKKAPRSSGSLGEGGAGGRPAQETRTLSIQVLAVDEQLLPAVQKAYDLNSWLLARVARLPRTWKFTLGDRLQTTALDLNLALVEAAHSKSRERPLYRASRLLDQLRILLRLARDLGALSAGQHEHASAWNEELGRMIGGWIRAIKAVPGRAGAGAASDHADPGDS